MERREFLRLGSLFTLGVIANPTLGVFEKIAQGLSNPQYVYKVKHRFGFWIVFSSQHPDFDNTKRTFLGSIDDAENLFYSNSLELISVVCENVISKKYLKGESAKLNADPELKKERLSNIKLTRGSSKIEKNIQNERESNLAMSVKRLNLESWWKEKISIEEQIKIFNDEKECLKNGWSFAGSGMTHNTSTVALVSLSVNFFLSQDDGSKKIFNPFKEIEPQVKEKEFLDINPYETDGIIGKQINLLLCLLNQYYSVSSTRDMNLANKFFEKIESVIHDSEKKLSLELRIEAMNTGIRYNYMRREEEIHFNKAKEICWDQISLYPEYLESLSARNNYVIIPHGFKQLAIVMEKEKNFVAAISICKKAISLGLEDYARQMNYTDAGEWDKRLKRLNSKIEKLEKVA